MQRSDGKVLTKQVPSTGVFFLRVPKNSTVIIGDKKIPGNNQLRMKVEPMEPVSRTEAFLLALTRPL